MPSQTEMKATMLRYIDLLNAGDLEGVMALYAEDATVEDPVGASLHQGQAAIRDFYTLAINSGAKLKLVGPQRGSHGNCAVMPVDVELNLPGAKMQIGVIEIMHFNAAGKVTSMQAFWGHEDMVTA